jgi:rod shape-determining protein MreB
MSVQGRDLLKNQNKWKSLIEIAKALDKSIQRIEDAVMETLSQTPPELAADIYNTGIYLAGGGSMLRGLDKRISQKQTFTLQKILSSGSSKQVWLKTFRNLKVS